MSKPIFVVRFPYSEEKRDAYLNFVKQISNLLTDYHVLAPMDNSVERVEFECFNVKDVPETEINEIKDMISNMLEETKKK